MINPRENIPQTQVKEEIKFDQISEKYEAVAKDLLRQELYDILQQAEKIQRFEKLGFSLSVIKGETVKIHTLRTSSRVDELPIDEEIKNPIKITSLIHDLPEVKKLIETGKTADTTAPEKALRVDLDEAIEKSEEEMARIIFNDDEFKLYLDFSNASDFLKNKKQETPTAVGLISKILDKIDADLHYHEMAIKNCENWKNLNEKGQSLAFDQYIFFSQRLDSLKDTEISDAAKLCQDLIDKTMLSIKEIWSETSPEEMPSLIQKGLQNFKINNN